MTYTGLNFDTVTGLVAMPLAFALERGLVGARAAQVFNIVGSLLLVNVLTIAVLSMPTPLRVFMNDPPNVWIADAPFHRFAGDLGADRRAGAPAVVEAFARRCAGAGSRGELRSAG